MTKFKKIVACGAALAMSVTTLNVSAQDDLDDLLKDLESETAKADAPKAEEPAAEKAEAPQAEAVADAPKAEESKPVAEAAVAAESAAEETEAEAVSNDKVDDVLNLLDKLAEETPKATPAAGKAEGARWRGSRLNMRVRRPTRRRASETGAGPLANNRRQFFCCLPFFASKSGCLFSARFFIFREG